MSDYLDPENEELLKDFFVEAETQVETMESTILAIETNPSDKDSIDELFRAAHTLKGGAYTVQMNELAAFTHKVEDLLDEVRNNKIAVSPGIIDLLLDSIDVIKVMFEERINGSIYTGDISDLEQKLLAMTRGEGAAPAPQKAASSRTKEPEQPKPASGGASFPEPLSMVEWSELNHSETPVFRVRVRFDESNPMNTIGAIQEFTRLKELGTIRGTHPDFEELYEDNFYEWVDYYIEAEVDAEDIQAHGSLTDVTLEVLVEPLNESMTGEGAEESDEEAQVTEVEAEPVPELEAVALAEEEEAAPAEEKKAAAKKEANTNSVLRVDSRRVDEILNLVSEAVINKATFNQVSVQLFDLMTELRSTHLQARERLGMLVENLLNTATRSPQGFSDNNGQSRNLRKELQNKTFEIHSLFDPLETSLKEIIAQFNNSAARLGRNTSDLHEAILGMRMVPIGQVFSRFPRLVRDLSRSLNKKVNLVQLGEDTEIDKSVAEELIDPLMHCVRNSMDHGIESQEIREQSNKPEVGTITLSAANEGNNVIIEISDDGGGINLEYIREKAIKNGVITANKQLTEQEAFNLIFDPGFSTAKQITNISGRGVGLDVVKKQIEKLNGLVNVWSVPGQGTRFTIKLPLTLAIIQGLLVKVRGEVYAIPITAVAESIRISKEDIRHIDNYEVINVRDDVVSLLRLNRIFQLEEEFSDDSGYMFVVVVGTEERRVGLMVDTLVGEEDVVIKPLVDRYTHSPGVAGATILGDGTVSLILDVSQLLDLGIEYERFMRSYSLNA